MANIKISDLTSASAAADANEYEINEAGTSKKVTGSQIKAYVNAGDGALASKNTVATADIDNLAVTTGKLAADAVDGTKIADDAIGNEHIATGAVNADSIASNAVGADELNVSGNGTSGQVLASDGDGTMSWFTLTAGGGFTASTKFTSPGTFAVPSNTNQVYVIVQGAGGGGGGLRTNYGRQASGGGAGGTAFGVVPVTAGGNVAVTVGTGGSGGTDAANPGTAGGASSFGTLISANGGGAGLRRHYAPSQPDLVNGGAGGTGVAPTGMAITGQVGGVSLGNASGARNYIQVAEHVGHGGSSVFGWGGTQGIDGTSSNTSTNSKRGLGYGSGGGGGTEGSSYISGRYGGSGAPGFVFVAY